MRVESAVELVNHLIYKPGWNITAKDHRNRFEGAIQVRIEYPARNSNREKAAKGYPEEIPGGTYAEFPVIVEDCDDTGLYRKIINKIIDIEAHEAREFLRVEPTCWAPFHPHRIDGMKRWGDVEGDLKFGIA